MPSNLIFHDLPDEDFALGSARIRAEPVSHRGPTVGLRIEEHGRALAYIPDHEPYLGAGPAGVDPEWLSGYLLAEGANVLMHDAQYFEHEYPSHVGWGHSSVDHAVSFAQACGVKRLVLFHHDPMHSDDQLRALEERARCALGPERAAPRAGLRGHEARPRHGGGGRGSLARLAQGCGYSIHLRRAKSSRSFALTPRSEIVKSVSPTTTDRMA